MTLAMTPVMENGHDPSAVNRWTLEQLSWWYLLRAERIKSQTDAQREAKRKHDRR